MNLFVYEKGKRINLLVAGGAIWRARFEAGAENFNEIHIIMKMESKRVWLRNAACNERSAECEPTQAVGAHLIGPQVALR